MANNSLVTQFPKPARSKNLSLEEQVTILTLRNQGVSCPDIADRIHRDQSTVSRFLVRMVDSSELARATLKAGAAMLASRVVKKANVAEAIDVLSRPDIAVLAPAVGKGGLPSGFGIQVSVGVATNGTVVKIEAGSNNGQRQLEEGSDGSVLAASAQVQASVPSGQE